MKINEKIMSDPRTILMFDLLYEKCKTEEEQKYLLATKNLFPMFYKYQKEIVKDPYREFLKLITNETNSNSKPS